MAVSIIFLILSILAAILLGILAGTLSGLTPGIHINLISILLLTFSTVLLTEYSFISPIILVVFLVAMAITHTFVDFIPSIFLGAPDEDNFLSILPGHEMLIKGEAYSAVVYTLYGSLAALLIILIFSPIFYFTLPIIYPYAESIMPLILLLTAFFLLYFEKSNRSWAIIIFLLSGILGLISLNLPMEQPLLPLFTGLFGVSSLLTSINKKQKLPKQKILPLKKIKPGLTSFFKSLFASILAAPLCSFLPGLGSGQAAVIGSEVIGELNKKEFLILLGAINTIVTGLSFITLYLIGKARTGIAVAIGTLINLTLNDLILLTFVIIITGLFSFIISIQIAKIFSKIIPKINYQKLSLIIIIFLCGIVFIFSGFLGLLLLAVSTIMGLLCIYAGIRRTHLMGCLIIPSIVLYLL